MVTVTIDTTSIIIIIVVGSVIKDTKTKQSLSMRTLSVAICLLPFHSLIDFPKVARMTLNVDGVFDQLCAQTRHTSANSFQSKTDLPLCSKPIRVGSYPSLKTARAGAAQPLRTACINFLSVLFVSRSNVTRCPKFNRRIKMDAQKQFSLNESGVKRQRGEKEVKPWRESLIKFRSTNELT